MSERRDDDLAPLVAELAVTLEELDERLDGTPSRREGLLRFTERYAIPTAIATLEANIRVLEAVAGAIRISQGRESSYDDGDSAGPLGALDRALSEVNDAVQGQPPDDDARRLLTEARALRDEIRDRVEADARRSPSDRRRTSDGDDATVIPVSAASSDPAVDVEAELDTIREEVDDEE